MYILIEKSKTQDEVTINTIRVTTPMNAIQKIVEQINFGYDNDYYPFCNSDNQEILRDELDNQIHYLRNSEGGMNSAVMQDGNDEFVIDVEKNNGDKNHGIVNIYETIQGTSVSYEYMLEENFVNKRVQFKGV